MKVLSDLVRLKEEAPEVYRHLVGLVKALLKIIEQSQVSEKTNKK